MQAFRNIGDDIDIEFGLDKFAKIVLKRGKLVQSQNIVLEFYRVIQELEQGKTHKYLGTEKSEGT